MFTISKRPTIAEVHAVYRAGHKPRDVVKFFLNRSQTLNKSLHAVLRYPEEHTSREVIWAEETIARYKSDSPEDWADKLFAEYPLFGIPYNLKDNILVEGLKATAASKIMEGYTATYSATVYEKLKAAGAILISQSNLDEWAVGSSTENSAYGPTKNPYDLTRVPGGSSGGPAAVVASGQAVFALGSDTGGSIRVPAAFTNTVGNKPTYGTISRYGVMPLSSSLDQIGAFTNTAQDNLQITALLAGRDEQDQTTANTQAMVEALRAVPAQIETEKIGERTFRIGLPQEYYGEGLDPQIRTALEELRAKLETFGHTLREVSLPLTKYGLAVYYTTMTVETASNLQRYDGIRYGHNAPDFVETRAEGLGDEPKRRIMLGAFASSSGYYDAYYNTAMKVREAMRRDFEKVFAKVDILLAPTTPEFPFKFGEKTEDPVKMYLSDALVYAANLARIPAISVPLGLFEVEGVKLPTGYQLIAPEFKDERLYQLAMQLEANAEKIS